MNVSKQKLKVHEQAYTVPLSEKTKIGKYELPMQPIRDVDPEMNQSSSVDVRPDRSPRGSMENFSELPELDKNMVQSVKSLREYRFRLPGNRQRQTSRLEESAAQHGLVGQGGEGVYVADCQEPAFNQLVEQIELAKEALKTSTVRQTMREAVLSKLTAAMDALNPAAAKGRLKVGKKKKKGVDKSNVLKGKRKRTPVARNAGMISPNAVDDDVDMNQSSSEPPPPPRRSKSNNRKKAGKGGSSRGIRQGDLVSADATVFDDPEEPGSWSDENPARCFGVVSSITADGKATVRWNEDGNELDIKLKDLRKEVAKATDARILVFLIEGSTIAYESQDKSRWPKDFFQLLVKKDWRKWVEAVKKELSGWEDNQAVKVVDIKDVPANAKIVPLGELYSIKRDGTYKFRQYLMGNLLREGLDFQDTFSTTVSGSGLCVFYSLATTCGKLVHGWDAICGYLQVKEQFDVYAFMPSHQKYSDLEHEEIGELRKSFLKIVAEQGEEGLRKFAKMHKRDTRSNPKQVLKCLSSVYGSPGAGHEFEMLMHFSSHPDGRHDANRTRAIYLRAHQSGRRGPSYWLCGGNGVDGRCQDVWHNGRS